MFLEKVTEMFYLQSFFVLNVMAEVISLHWIPRCKTRPSNRESLAELLFTHCEKYFKFE